MTAAEGDPASHEGNPRLRVFSVPGNGELSWFFFDECGERKGPFGSEAEAQGNLDVHCDWLVRHG